MHAAGAVTLRPAHSYDKKPTPPRPGTQRAHHATTARALSTTRTPDAARVAARTPPQQQQPQPQGSTTREHATLHAARTARARIAPPQEAAPPNSRH